MVKCLCLSVSQRESISTARGSKVLQISSTFQGASSRLISPKQLMICRTGDDVSRIPSIAGCFTVIC